MKNKIHRLFNWKGGEKKLPYLVFTYGQLLLQFLIHKFHSHNIVMPSMTDPPFAGSFFDSFDDLFAAVQRHARQEGWAVIKTHASSRRADGNYYRYHLGCDRGTNHHQSIATGRRQASSRKEGCPWKGVAVARKSDGDLWRYETINSTHNHAPSLDASVHPMHRRLTDEERGALERHT